MQKPERSTKNSAGFSRIIMLLILTLGLFSIQASFWPGISQQQPTRTPTATRFIIGEGFNACGNGLANLNLSIQYQIIQETRAVKSSFCGRLVTLTQFRGKNLLPNKQVTRTLLGVVPCKGGGIYILNMRPRELYGYYEFVNVVKSTGRKINTKEFGPVSTYIDRFQTYYPLNNCSECGQISQGYVPFATQEVVFPVLTQPPSSTLIVPLIVPSATPESASPTPTASPSLTPTQISPSVTPVSLESRAAPIAQSTPAAPMLSGSFSSQGSQPFADVRELKPPTEPPKFGFLSYSLYTLVLIPLIVLVIIVRQKRPI